MVLLGGSPLIDPKVPIPPNLKLVTFNLKLFTKQIGPTLPISIYNRTITSDLLNWLNEGTPVVYVAFGTVVAISGKEAQTLVPFFSLFSAK